MDKLIPPFALADIFEGYGKVEFVSQHFVDKFVCLKCDKLCRRFWHICLLCFCRQYFVTNDIFVTGDFILLSFQSCHDIIFSQFELVIPYSGTTRDNNWNAEGIFGVMAAQKKSMVTLAKIKLIEILFISICLNNRKS
jgi:hypothetical protein